MVFANTNKEITLIYNSTDHVGQQILAYAQIEKMPIHDIDLTQEKLTKTHWAELASRMGIAVRDLLNTTSPDFSEKFGPTNQFSDDDWLTLLVNNPSKLKAPIVMKGDKIARLNNPQEMIYFTT
jgi:arsenate reductase